MNEKKLMLGNEAVARGLYEAGCTFVSSYPGTPSTEITEYAAEYEEIYAEWAPNEKVALEAAMGASIGGARAFCGMKHVGLNVAADPLFISSYIGVNGGLVIGVADDSGMHSSQNEQDSRHYAIAAKIPMLEPSDSDECKNYIKTAFELSEKFDTPFIIRLQTRISHSQSMVKLCDRENYQLKDYVKDPSRYVMMPSNARFRHVEVEKHIDALTVFAENCEFNTIEYNICESKEKIGIISSGISFMYAKEVFGDSVSYLKLGLINPMPTKLIKDFAGKMDRVIVVEELDDVIEMWCKSIGVMVDGKNIFSKIGEYSQEIIREKVLEIAPEYIVSDEKIPMRPPVLCPGCPHRGIFYLLKKLKLMVSGDIGCYTLGAVAPLNSLDTTLCMGASVSALHGFNMARGRESAKTSVAVIGDSTFMHSGITGIVNIVYNQGFSNVLILDNSITGMTGHQQNPCTGYTLKGEPVYGIKPEDVCRGAGIKNIRISDPCDLAETEKILKEELEKDEPSVIIIRRPCALLKSVKKDKYCEVKNEACKGCKMCMQIGCPAISFDNESRKAKIDTAICAGCGLCEKLCKFNAIENINR